jgi:hypothetical protein
MEQVPATVARDLEPAEEVAQEDQGQRRVDREHDLGNLLEEHDRHQHQVDQRQPTMPEMNTSQPVDRVTSPLGS